MEAKQFTQDAAVMQIIESLKEEGIDKREFSDVTDGVNQYVDLVMEGGGVLGVALAGYVHVLEQMNIRFLQLGGTSAGAINTMLMAAAGKINETKTDWILEKIANKDFNDFVDGDRDARKFIDSLLNDAGKLKLLMTGAQVVDNAFNDFGLNPGNNFHQWIKNILNQRGIKTTKDLREYRRLGPEGGLYNRHDRTISYGAETYERVVIIASEITTESKVIFPEMAHLYWGSADMVNPADYVRASMSIPFFFHPYKVSGIPQGAEAWREFKNCTGFVGNLPSEVVFVDGGVMSNFPIDIFHHRDHIPESPTFGAKLGIDRDTANKTDKLFSYIGSIFDSARHIHDYDFIMRNPEYRRLICMIETGDHNWLNFNITDEAKIDLFIRGAKAAANFLRAFDWNQYKEIRKHVKEINELTGSNAKSPAAQG